MKIDAFFILLTLLWVGSIVLQCIPAGENVNDGLVWTGIISTALVGIVPALNSLDNEMSKKLKALKRFFEPEKIEKTFCQIKK